MLLLREFTILQNMVTSSTHFNSKYPSQSLFAHVYIGFKTSKIACCGTGPFRGIYSCGGKRQVKEYKLCKNVKNYIFFDSGHLTQVAYKQVAELLWNGTVDVIEPYNLKSFFDLPA